jgi:hypothetical protein
MSLSGLLGKQAPRSRSSSKSGAEEFKGEVKKSS